MLHHGQHSALHRASTKSCSIPREVVQIGAILLNSSAFTGVLHRSLKNNVSINLNINVDDKFIFQI